MPGVILRLLRRGRNGGAAAKIKAASFFMVSSFT